MQYDAGQIFQYLDDNEELITSHINLSQNNGTIKSILIPITILSKIFIIINFNELIHDLKCLNILLTKQ